MEHLLRRPGRPRPGRGGSTGDLRCPRRSGRGDRGEPAGRRLAALPHSLCRQPHGHLPKSMWPAVKAMLHSVYDQPTAEAVNAQFDRLLEYTEGRLPDVADHLATPAKTCSPSLRSPTTCGDRSGPTIPPNGSTARSAAAPTWSGSFPTAMPSSASSEPSWPSRPTNGPKNAATSAWKSSTAATHPDRQPPTPARRRR